eukprot:CAMPEP_0196776516 /NCGR_PEP_ID=MMETSP1104-20130614/4675_1 /TAXON_ID=33652 /ORGANISM="Cafeteria sp., Strain Caron Lab Isolate" /LENGTH=39 /DNA_ID= /DNA_START= /DNA_END= /DNA_ORIENTATION=
MAQQLAHHLQVPTPACHGQGCPDPVAGRIHARTTAQQLT